MRRRTRHNADAEEETEQYGACRNVPLRIPRDCCRPGDYAAAHITRECRVRREQHCTHDDDDDEQQQQHHRWRRRAGALPLPHNDDTPISLTSTPETTTTAAVFLLLRRGVGVCDCKDATHSHALARTTYSPQSARDEKSSLLVLLIRLPPSSRLSVFPSPHRPVRLFLHEVCTTYTRVHHHRHDDVDLILPPPRQQQQQQVMIISCS